MTETPPDYSSNEDHGDAQPDAPGPWMARFDAAYAQALVEQAQAERDAALRQVRTLLMQLVEAEARATAFREALAHCNRLLTHDATQRVHGRRDA